MQTHGGASDHSLKNKKPKSRDVSSRFLSPTDNAIQSPNSILSPIKQKPRSSTDSRKHKSFEQPGFLRGLWPSSSPSSNSKPNTLADHLGNDRRKDLEERKNKQNGDHNQLFLNRQRSCTQLGRFEQDQKKNYSASKENHKPIFGGSMRYTGKKSSKFSNLCNDDNQNDIIVPGRFSFDDNIAIRKKSSTAGSGLSDSDTQDSESESSDIWSAGTPASYMAPTLSSRKHGIQVSSKFMHNLSSRSRRWSADSGLHQNPNSFDNNKGKMTSLKPPTSPCRGKGVGNILSKGIELFKGKKSWSPGSAENVHQLRLLHNRLMQWRYSNSRAEVVNRNVIKQVERDLVYVLYELVKLQDSVLQKKLLLQREKLEMRLNYILQSQIKGLEMWGNMERHHLSAISITKNHLHSVVCKIPLVHGAKVESQSASIVVRHASDLASSINMMLTTFSPMIEKTAGVVGELAMVVTQEKLLLQECFELFRNISALEIQERSLSSTIIQSRILQQQHHHQQLT